MYFCNILDSLIILEWIPIIPLNAESKQYMCDFINNKCYIQLIESINTSPWIWKGVSAIVADTPFHIQGDE